MTDVLIHNLAFFKDLSADQIAVLRPLFTPCDFYSDTMIFEQGTQAENLYIVVVGEVVVNYKPDDGPPITVARVQPGGIVGWSAALGSRNYTSAAITTMYTQLLSVRGSDLRAICRQHPDIGHLIQERLAEVIVQRVRNTHAQVVALLELSLGSPEEHQER